ncbi:kinase-like protein [Panus rudis PR-1116 ss-1]|nr:kinase-like protein [Panus rudis PR-1116 ss-1]
MLDSWSLHNHFLTPSPSSDVGRGEGGSSSTTSRSSHLSILTSTSSISSSTALSDAPQVPSPLPSPSHSASGSSKTNAFFASPFGYGDNDTPTPPPNPPSRASSLKSSRNADFFSTPSEETRPKPPPSLRSLHASPLTSPESSPPGSPPPGSQGQGRHLPPIARFFPSRARYTNVDGLPSREPSSSTRRDFLFFDSHQHPPHQGQHTYQHHYQYQYQMSPTSSLASTSAASTSADPVHVPVPLSLSSANTAVEHPLLTDLPSAALGPSGLPTPLAGPPPPPPSSSSNATTPLSSANVQSHFLSQPPPSPSSSSLLQTQTQTQSHPYPHSPRQLPPEPEPDPISTLSPGDTLSDDTLTLELVRTLGQGAFSSVWLARDLNGQLGKIELSRKSSLIRSRSRKGRNGSVRRGARMEGTVPIKKKSRDLERESSLYLSCAEVVGGNGPTSGDGDGDGEGERRDDDKEMTNTTTTTARTKKKEGRLVAVKLTDRALCEKNDRTRVSFVREVEILRHISHPSIISYIHSFSTPTHHCLLLEHVPGGDLFDLVDSAEKHAMLDERVLRRMFGELCKAVGWMHGVGLVHRDIKLENILLTSSTLTLPPPTTPLIKLTDFGLSRFIDPAQPLLTTRCGSESYAAPELVTGRPYDGRETDAWACGVVLFASVTRRLPFDRVRRGEEVRTGAGAGAGGRTDGNGTLNVDARELERGREDRERRMVKEGEYDRIERKALLVRIAKGEYTWPDFSSPSNPSSSSDPSSSPHHPPEPPKGTALSLIPSIRRIVSKLLVRDPRKRAKVVELWEDEWMRGDGAPPLPSLSVGVTSRAGSRPHSRAGVLQDGQISLEPQLEPLERVGDSSTGTGDALGLTLNPSSGDVALEIGRDVDGEREIEEEVDIGEGEGEGEGDGEGESEEGILVDEDEIKPGSVACQEH